MSDESQKQQGQQAQKQAHQVRIPHQVKQIKSVLSTRTFYGLTPVNWLWAGHVGLSAWLGYQVWSGVNPFAAIGMDAPLYKVGIVAIMEGARAILSIANVYEEEINWLASTLLIVVLMTASGADVGRISEVTPHFSYNANVAQPNTTCTWRNIKSGATLNDAEIKWCKETQSDKCVCN